MGLCISCQTTPQTTGKLILPDGTLQEFTNPIKVSDILNKHPSTFICNSDEMDFDDVVFAMKHDENLQPGQLYFALPLKQLKHRLQPEEMAALAVKASAALAKCGYRKEKKNVCFTTSFNGEKGRQKRSSKVADVQSVGLSRKSCGVAAGAKRGNFKVMLSAIPE